MEKMVSRGVGGKEKKLEFEALKKIEECLNNNIEIRAGKWTSYEVCLLWSSLMSIDRSFEPAPALDGQACHLPLQHV